MDGEGRIGRSTKQERRPTWTGRPPGPLGYVLLAFEWDWAAAAAALSRAVELNPNDSAIRNWYASFLMVAGRTDEALNEMTIARELDPLSPIVNVGVGLAYMFGRRYEETVTVLQDLLSNVPNFPPARLALARVFLIQGRIEEGISELETLVAQGGSAEQRAELARAYALGGREEEARGILEDLRDPPDSGLVSLSLAWLQLGERDEAVRWLTEAYEDRSIMMITLRAPHFDLFRSDPGTRDVLRRMSFPG